jgi:hypothetical protein
MECHPAAAAGFPELDEYCRERGERFPLLAARLALGALQRAAAAAADGTEHTTTSSSSTKPSSSSSSSSSSSPPLGDLSFLCFVNVGGSGGGGTPDAWRDSFRLLKSGVDSLVTSVDGEEAVEEAAAAAARALDLAW